jgi:hypothetical protein
VRPVVVREGRAVEKARGCARRSDQGSQPKKATLRPCVRSARIIRQDVLVDGALSSPRELVVDDDVDVRESLERGLPLRCRDFAADTKAVDVSVGDLCRRLESTGAPRLLHTGVGFAWGAR